MEDGLALEGGGEGGRGSEVWWSRTMSMRWDGREVAARDPPTDCAVCTEDRGDPG